MRLSDLLPTFLTYKSDGEWTIFTPVASMAEAHGIEFHCPKCWQANGGPVGTHIVIAWRRGLVPDSAHPSPGRWEFSGSHFGDLSLDGSIQTVGGCAAHFNVKNGEIVNLT